MEVRDRAVAAQEVARQLVMQAVLLVGFRTSQVTRRRQVAVEQAERRTEARAEMALSALTRLDSVMAAAAAGPASRLREARVVRASAAAAEEEEESDQPSAEPQVAAATVTSALPQSAMRKEQSCRHLQSLSTVS